MRIPVFLADAVLAVSQFVASHLGFILLALAAVAVLVLWARRKRGRERAIEGEMRAGRTSALDAFVASRSGSRRTRTEPPR